VPPLTRSRFAADVFGPHRAVVARLGRVSIAGEIHTAGDQSWWPIPTAAFEALGLDVGDAADLSLRADR
jgi:hypothetical protein